ncbi:DUF5317 family protein [Acetobacterium woodii]|uniref:DUF5317 domain-containing protein n=1 Tax=Acetobacterium woodii (strain ATCC 29683 / DSM 1030 / JCM 2381 / KCTC 1655 / WB1) TaxID=931626 RepID=H6LJ06_ACEWD|nr:DUF5317 family protein [Acetobacterium woodii]AFA47369.1 hypothetical protein Awo_c05700 [Acetobacterium woodii DSM 1030]
MIITFIVAIVFAKFRGGEIRFGLKSPALYPPICCEIGYLILQLLVMRGNYQVIGYADIFKKIYLLSFLFPIVYLKLYKPGLIGAVFVSVGTWLNNWVMQLNGGKMPVFPSLSYLTGYVKADTFQKINDIHILGNADTKMIIFSDIIDVGWSVLSIGDILIRVFAGIVIYSAIIELNKQKNESFQLKPIFKYTKKGALK